MYSLMVVTLVSVFSRIREKQPVPKLRVCHAIVLYGLNVFIQLFTVLFLLIVAEQLHQKNYRHPYGHGHYESVRDAGEWLQKAVETGDPGVSTAGFEDLGPTQFVIKRCEEEVNVPYPAVYYFIIFWWALFVVNELRNIATMSASMLRVPNPEPNGVSPLLVEETCTVVFLASWMKAAIFVLISVVKTIIALALAWAGCKYLLLQTNPFSLVLKVLAFKLIVEFDELLVDTLSSWEMHQTICGAGMRAQRGVYSQYWAHGVGGTVYFLAAAGFVLLFTEVVFMDLMFFRRQCINYMDTFLPNRTVEALNFEKFLFDG